MKNKTILTLNKKQFEEYLGPYEAWVFGDGKSFAFPSLNNAILPFYTALAEMDPTENAIKSGKYKTPETTVIVPPLWSAPDFVPRFTPLIYFLNDDKNSFQKGDRSFSHSPGKPNFLLNDTDLNIFHKPDNSSSNSSLKSSEFQNNTHKSKKNRASFRTNFLVEPSSIYGGEQKTSSKSNWQPNCELSQKKKKVAIIAIIDDALPFANKSFLDSEGTNTKVEFCWLQSGEPIKKSDVPFGREYTNKDIDELIGQYGKDEDYLYEKAGAVSIDNFELGTNIRYHATHGSHILSTAAGNDPSNPDELIPDEVRIIMVQLPNTVAWDTSGFGKDMHMLSAVHYILNRANKLAEKYAEAEPDKQNELPLVINFSYGWSGGRHDGEDYLEAAIGELVQQRRKYAPTAMVMPSGNTFEDELHGKFSLDEQQKEFTFGWKVSSDDRTSSYLEIWFPYGEEPFGYNFNLSQPGTDLTKPISTGKISDLLPLNKNQTMASGQIKIDEKTVGQLSIDKHRNSRWRILIALAPTQSGENIPNPAPAGTWKITLGSGTPIACSKEFHCWVQRDNDPIELKTGGKQSKLIDLMPKPKNKDPLASPSMDSSFICSYGTLTGLCNHKTTTVVGGYISNTLHPASYSSAGVLKTSSDGSLVSEHKEVDCSAISERSNFLKGNIAGGVKSQSRSWLIGTSAAAPLVARQLVSKFLFGNPTVIATHENSNYVTLLTDSQQTSPTQRFPTVAEENEDIKLRAQLGSRQLKTKYINL